MPFVSRIAIQQHLLITALQPGTSDAVVSRFDCTLILTSVDQSRHYSINSLLYRLLVCWSQPYIQPRPL